MITVAGVILVITGVVASMSVPYRIAVMIARTRADSYPEYLDVLSSLVLSPWATVLLLTLLGVVVGGGICALRKRAWGWAFTGAVCSAIAMGFYALFFALPGVLAAIILLAGRREFEMARYDKAVKSDPCNAGVYCDRGDAYTERAEYDRAIADYRKAVELDPCDARAFFNRAYAYGETGDYDKAIADYSRAIELDPADAQAFYNRALDYLKRSEVPKAVSDLETAIGLSVDPELKEDGRRILHKLKNASSEDLPRSGPQDTSTSTCGVAAQAKTC